MIIIHTAAALRAQLDKERKKGSKTGFVPTMGALHAGHISLIEASRSATGFTVSSIFVNPTQFNNPDDLQKYPRTLEKDIDMLEAAGCDLLYLPEAEDIYPADYKPRHYELGQLDKVLEGEHRPGHFQGVCQVVDILLSQVNPDMLFLGEKDFQQCAVIKKLIEITGRKTEIIVCPTIREADGLAMSSRNMRLTHEDREKASAIFRTLMHLKTHLAPGRLDKLKREAREMLEEAGFRVEYAEIAEPSGLSSAAEWDGNRRPVALVAAWLGEVRLIDNMTI